MKNTYYLLIAIICGCSVSEPTQHKTQPQTQQIKAKAEELAKAYQEGDIARMLPLVHPALFEKAGGKDKFIERIRWELDLRKQSKMAINSQLLEEPKEVVSGGIHLFAIVPETQEILHDTTKKRVIKSAWIAISSDKGKTWTFIHSSHFHGKDVKDLLPDFPESLEVPR